MKYHINMINIVFNKMINNTISNLIKTFVLAFTIHCSLFTVFCFSQGVGINISGSSANSKALLDIDVTGMNQKKGLLLPRMSTAERNAIATPIPESLLIYNTDSHCFEANYNGSWVPWACLGGCQAPVSPIAGAIAPDQNQIVWNWNIVSGATGYKWSTASSYNSAIDNGSSTSYTQTGLACNTSYSFYLWAYNSCGNYSPPALLQSASSCCYTTYICNSNDIRTIAGNGTAGFNGDGNQGVCAQLRSPQSVAVDASGNVYFADAANERVRKVDLSTGIITTIAGNGISGYNGDGIPATNAELQGPYGIATDGSGNVYIADHFNNRIRKVTVSTGLISTVAGNGTGSFSGDGGVATAAGIWFPYGIALDASGNVYIGDMINERVRKVNVSDGIISTIAGNGIAGFSGDGSAATDAEFHYPGSLVVDGLGNLYVGDLDNYRIRKITASTGIVTTIAGNGTAGYNGDSIFATTAELNTNALDGPCSLAIDASGNLYICDNDNNRIRKVNASDNIITTFAGIGTGGFSGDGGAAVSSEILNPNGIAIDNLGNIYIGDSNNNRIREICE